MADSMAALSLSAFSEQLASKAPVPGGGGVAALVGALAAALGSMAANLTMGKKKFLPLEPDHRRIIGAMKALQCRFLELMDEDAAAFEPLSQAYSLDRSIPENAENLRSATLNASQVPLEMMQHCCELITLLEELQGKCSVLLLSDVGCAALTARCALEAASMNVFVNTCSLFGNAEAKQLEEKAVGLLKEYMPRAQAISDNVMDYLRRSK